MAGLRAAPTCGKAGCKEANGGVKPLMKGHKCPERQPSKKKRKLDDGTAATSATSQTLQSLLLPPTLAANATPSVESVLRTSATGSTPLASFQHRAGSVPGSQSAPLLISGSEPALDATLALLAFDASSGTTTNAMSEDSVPSLYESTLLAYLMGNTAACSQMPVDFTRGDGCPSPPHSSCPSPPHSSSPSPPHSSSPSPPRSGSPSPPRSNSPDMDLSFTSTTGSILSHAVCAT
ncbi:hypothetical protein PLICRDRAFT_353334 [Plicaturopsis crispa FD-325 SS-3]|uniref:Uncharacterized protein n=1 Tax=Plicaturopsis crispa FD-325 SS-3 TaxID=944288 RepID=A0A0C9SKZ1_PLICR|nr:hypothetical protein PLICRDRAFT_353334 [Plicaturopsis crispa FD-325 SS-3]